MYQSPVTNLLRNIFFATILFLIVVMPVAAATPTPQSSLDIPPGTPVTLRTIENIITTLTSFLLYVGGTIATFMVVLSGILWTTSGDNPDRLKAAKAMLKAAIIGAVIIFGVGVILSTIENCIQGDCVYGRAQTATPRPTVSNRPSSPTPRPGRGVGESCRADQECEEGLECNGATSESVGTCLPN